MHTQDTYRIAIILVEEYGAYRAQLIAARCCETLLVRGGDLDELLVWKDVRCMVEEIVRMERDAGSG
jgi:hypothetical protein